jgi:hypothetical protein
MVEGARLRRPVFTRIQFSLSRMTNIVYIQNKSRLDQGYSHVRYGEKPVTWSAGLVLRRGLSGDLTKIKAG